VALRSVFVFSFALVLVCGFHAFRGPVWGFDGWTYSGHGCWQAPRRAGSCEARRKGGPALQMHFRKG